ncbi:hypothetical protein GUJ93_ZPchr0001g31198 [Zizania palustris]|uniref:Uncharacterized protein n=1 Tax=Zizania palustris TaxID=103762 RepID=A0A8J5V8S8_ZIZPA|nr:hypothetical protein GUJ93_ZPchr0001g31198 [Zizania palustris]
MRTRFRRSRSGLRETVESRQGRQPNPSAGNTRSYRGESSPARGDGHGEYVPPTAATMNKVITDQPAAAVRQRDAGGHAWGRSGSSGSRRKRARGAAGEAEAAERYARRAW